MDSRFRTALRRSNFGLATVLLSLPVASCSEESAQASQDPLKAASVWAQAQAQARHSAFVQKPESNGAAHEGQTGTMNQSDELSLEMADRACRSDDFKSFFRAFSGSSAVREQHAAAYLTVGLEGRSRRMTRQQYMDKSAFPVSPMDNDYVTAASADNFARSGNGHWRDLLYVRLAFDFAQDSRVRVEWTPGTFERHLDTPPPELQEGLGQMIRQTGQGGFLLFAPTGTCWELAADIAQPAGQHLDQ
jgi:hypothetical protein